MTPLEHVVERSYETGDTLDVSVGEPRWMAKAREYLDTAVGRPLGKLGLFAADSRRRRSYLKDNLHGVGGFSKIGALTGAGSQPKWSLDSLDEYTDVIDEQTGGWSDGIGDSFDAEDISTFHIRYVDPLSASSMFVKGSGSMFALHQLGVPTEYAAKGVGAALIGKGIQAGVRNYVLDAYDEHSSAPVNFLMSPSPWAWLGVGGALKAFSYARRGRETGWEGMSSNAVAGASYGTPLRRNEASIKRYGVNSLYEE